MTNDMPETQKKTGGWYTAGWFIADQRWCRTHHTNRSANANGAFIPPIAQLAN